MFYYLVGELGQWQSWSECSAVCGARTKTRVRQCIGGECPPSTSTSQTIACDDIPCGRSIRRLSYGKNLLLFYY